MNVHDSIVACLKNWPSLHTTRLEALKVMFSYSGSEWVDGEMINQPSTQTASGDYPDAVEPELADGDGYLLLCKLRRESEQKFVVDNAELIAVASIGFTPYPEWKDRWNDCWEPYLLDRLDEMPENVTDEWAKAAEEIAYALWRETRGCPEKTHGYNTHRGLEPFLLSRGVALRSKADENKSMRAAIEELLTDL
jgi:hypothetical protein